MIQPVSAPMLDPVAGVLTTAAWAARTRAILARPPGDAPHEWAVLVVGLDQQAATTAMTRSTLLPAVGRVLVATAGPAAVVGRLDGNDFLVLAPCARWTHAHIVGEGLRRAVAEIRDRHTGEVAGLTASVGAALLPPRPRSENLTRAFWFADSALFEAKRAGQDRVRVARTWT